MAIDRQNTTMPVKQDGGAVLEQVMIQGDLKSLSPTDRMIYYRNVCESLGLNPMTKPFDFITLNGKLTLYARKDATDQLRDIKNVSVIITDRTRLEGVYVVTARAALPDGRTDEAIGAVAIEGLKGDNLCNALMKAETKAKRRVTLSICGLGWTDETEIETIPSAHRVVVDTATGGLQDPPKRFTPPASPGSAGQPDPLGNGKVDAAEAKRLVIVNKIQDHFDAEPFNSPQHQEAWIFKYAGIEGDWTQAKGATLMTLAACVKARSKGDEIEPCEAWTTVHGDNDPLEDIEDAEAFAEYESESSNV